MFTLASRSSARTAGSLLSSVSGCLYLPPPRIEPRRQPRSLGNRRLRRDVDLWFFRPIVDVTLRLSTGHYVPFHWVRETYWDVVKPSEFAEWHPGDWLCGCLAVSMEVCCTEGCRADDEALRSAPPRRLVRCGEPRYRTVREGRFQGAHAARLRVSVAQTRSTPAAADVG